MVSNSLTFALGPNLMNGSEEDADDEKEQKEDETDEEQPTEHTSLMPNHVQHHGGRLMQHTKRRAEQNWQDLPSWFVSSALTVQDLSLSYIQEQRNARLYLAIL